jgi:FlaA1/EpsC-like NDP-sugar epimerase
LSLAVGEGLVLFLAVCGTIYAWGHLLFLDWLDVATMVWQAAAVSLCCIVAFYYNDLYDLRVVRSFSLFASRLLQSFGVALMLLAGFYTLFPDTRIGEGVFVSSLVVSAGLLVPLRAVGYTIMRRRAFADRVLILGTGALARRVIQEIESRPNFRYAVAGVVDEGNGTDVSGLPYPVLGPLERLDKIIDDMKPDRLIVSLTERRGRMPMGQLLECGARGSWSRMGSALTSTSPGSCPSSR